MAAVRSGGVYLVADSKIKLLPAEERQTHAERRRFVVLSCPAVNSDPKWISVTGCPISGSTRFRTRFDVQLGYGEAGVTKKCWIRVSAIQSLHKTDIEDLTGTLSGDRLGEVQARLLQYLGITGDAADHGEPDP